MLFLALASPSSATRLGVGCHCADTVDIDLVCKVQGCKEEVTNLSLIDGKNVVSLFFRWLGVWMLTDDGSTTRSMMHFEGGSRGQKHRQDRWRAKSAFPRETVKKFW